MRDFEQKVNAILADGSKAPRVLDRLWPLFYDELRRIAAARMRTERQITYQPTALVNETFLRLQLGNFQPVNRDHLINAAAKAMWQILIDAARRRRAIKHGGGRTIHITETEWLELIEAPPQLSTVDIEALLEALERLRGASPQFVRAFELIRLQGYSAQEAGEIMDLKPDTVVRYAGNAMRYFRAQAGKSR